MKDFLSAKGVTFTLKDVGSDKSARDELVAKFGRMATPALVIGEKVFLGFKQNREEIERVVAEFVGGGSG